MTPKALIPILGIFLLGMTGCQTAKTSSNAPSSTSADRVEVPNAESSKAAKDDATSQVRRDQLNADIRAREQRNNALNQSQATNRTNSDIASEVRSKLEANLPASALTVSAKDGVVTVAGTVADKAQFARIEGLAKEIKGVKAVNLKVAVVNR